ncbi:hypothetical protein HK096_004755, partial [Nowakowskiella sp. JEL0078]
YDTLLSNWNFDALVLSILFWLDQQCSLPAFNIPDFQHWIHRCCRISALTRCNYSNLFNSIHFACCKRG